MNYPVQSDQESPCEVVFMDNYGTNGTRREKFGILINTPTLRMQSAVTYSMQQSPS
jgi:hypothetical protein